MTIPPPESLWFRTAAPIAADDSLPAHAEIVVAGAGLTGVVTALLLARRGHRVVLLEARKVGAATTGHTTGKLSLLQGDVFGDIRSHAGDDALRAYTAANRAGQEWMLDELASDPLIIQRRTARTFAATPLGDGAVDREEEAVQIAGLPAQRVSSAEIELLGLPLPVSSMLVMEGQWQVHPIRLLGRLITSFREAGGRVIEGCRVSGAELSEGGVQVETVRGGIACTALVIATGTPILDRGLFFAKGEPSRSLVGAYAVPADIRLPRDMYLSVDEDARSLRTARDETGAEVLVVGSRSFVPGREPSTAIVLSELDAWTALAYPGSKWIAWWGAQDYRAAARLPFAGAMPRGGGRVFTGTGYNKWGMTNAVAAALAIAGDIAGAPPDWADALRRATPVTAASAEALAINASVGRELVGGWMRAETTAEAAGRPAEGDGVIAHAGLRPVAESTVDGVTCRVSGVCTHLGGILRWNDAERSWDCPLHGSRFTPDGEVLEGPAVHALRPVE